MRKRSRPESSRTRASGRQIRAARKSNGASHSEPKDPQASRLARAFARIGSPRLRAKIVMLVEALGAKK